jgi:hypothetical protein
LAVSIKLSPLEIGSIEWPSNKATTLSILTKTFHGQKISSTGWVLTMEEPTSIVH